MFHHRHVPLLQFCDSCIRGPGAEPARDVGETVAQPRPATISSNSIIATVYSKCKKELMADIGKRSVQVNVRLSEQDFRLIKQAAAKIWPDAVLTNSGILLGLAKIAAKQVVDSPKK